MEVAVSATGNWTLTITTPFTLKPLALKPIDGGNGALAGSILEQGSTEQPQQIQNGKVTGASLYWQTSKPVKSAFSGTLTNNTIAGTVTTVGNNVPFNATRS
jgi:hypothetical protein